MDFEEAVDDVIPIALAQKFRQRLADQKAETSKANEEVEQMKSRGKKVDHLYCRRIPTDFLDCLKRLTPRNIKAIHELGFGAILSFNIKEIPGYLAYWVLTNFNLARCKIPLSGGEDLTLDEEDVHLTLGFPRGPTRIQHPTEKQSNFVYNDYAAQRCNKGRFNMAPGDVGQMMMEDVDGGPDFKKLFMFMLENVAIETPSNGNGKPKILHFIDDVDEIQNMNWCGYLLSVLEVTYPS
ncbi:uncharacterized protein LOC121789502 [Salvia splendens]|uniref:uncharacterized protein LOC121789502 n=1 Tax=Salvia splendens TaxID=180675 RepID=UPI001C279971|nr:uncharacterized protein LOC121789502 [Salvia splendens]